MHQMSRQRSCCPHLSRVMGLTIHSSRARIRLASFVGFWVSSASEPIRCGPAYSDVRCHTMHTAKRAILSLLAVVGLLLLLPGVIYAVGMLKVHGLPTPADPAAFDRKLLAATWMACREAPPATVHPLNPWGVTARLLLADLRAKPGERAAWQIAKSHNISHPVGSNLWWHTSGSALTIWITRNWSADQISATLARDGLCK